MERTGWFQSADREQRYLVGVSGGADSVALMHLLVRSGFQDLVVCHLNHGLRGGAAEKDSWFVENLAKQHGLKYELGRANIEKREGSLETVARLARQLFFAQCSEQWGSNKLLLGHHADDQAETVLWNLLRGSRGASGMQRESKIEMAGRPLLVIRPLLPKSRDELREWLRRECLEWREDATNAELFCARNRIRHEALPLLESIAKRPVAAALVKAASSDTELREIEKWAVENAAAVDPSGRLHIPRLKELPAAVRRACIFKFLVAAGVEKAGRGDVERVDYLIENGGACDLPGGWRVRRRQGRLVIEHGKKCPE